MHTNTLTTLASQKQASKQTNTYKTYSLNTQINKHTPSQTQAVTNEDNQNTHKNNHTNILTQKRT